MNPENMNQDAANQGMTNQNPVFPGQNPQAPQNPFAQTPPLMAPLPTPLPTPPTKSKKPLLIAGIVGALVLLIVIVYVVCIVVRPNESDDLVSNIDNTSNENAAEKVVGAGSLDKFEKMTKDEAMAFLQASRSTGGYIPENYVGEEILDALVFENNVVVRDLALRYSYDTLDDLRQTAGDWYSTLSYSHSDVAEDDYEIKEYDYYAIVTPNRIEGTDTCDYEYYGSCNALLSFKRDYLNYFQEETEPHSFNDVTYVSVRDPETVEDLMRIVSLFFWYGAASGHGNIYGYSFEEQEDKFMLTVYYVGVGLNMDKIKEGSSEIEYAINLYSRSSAVDKADGRLYVIRTGEESTVENIRSIPLTQEEASSLLGGGY